jgi:hypothetical protein
MMQVKFGNMVDLANAVIENNNLTVDMNGSVMFNGHPLVLDALKEEDRMHYDHERLPTLMAFIRFCCLKEQPPVVTVPIGMK